MTAIKRKIDNLGRFVIPNDFREMLGIKNNDTLLVYTDGESVIIKPQARVCAICGAVIDERDKNICKKCIEHIKSL